eukprot:3583698-Pyramimonas_sp.AAC.1
MAATSHSIRVGKVRAVTDSGWPRAVREGSSPSSLRHRVQLARELGSVRSVSWGLGKGTRALDPRS